MKLEITAPDSKEGPKMYNALFVLRRIKQTNFKFKIVIVSRALILNKILRFYNLNLRIGTIKQTKQKVLKIADLDPHP
jgi:hypothetical protein